MTTPFKALLLALLPCCYVGAATPQDTFAAVREGVLSGNVAEAGDDRFGLARARPRTTTSTSKQAAKSQATLLASANLLQRAALESVTWPETLSAKDRAALAQTLAARLNLSAKVHGLQAVYEAYEPMGWVVVVALPKSETAPLRRMTFEEARSLLLSESAWLAAGAPIDALLALHATEKPLPPSIDRAPWQAPLEAARFGTPRLRALPRLAGCAPLGNDTPPADADFASGQAAYGRGDLAAAYEAFLASAERVWTYDALNMAGNVARRLGKNAEAVPLLLHAAYLRPASPHPWVHLAFVAEALGAHKLAETCCQAAEARAPDAWSVAQIAHLREALSPAPQPEPQSEPSIP